ncbi:MAG: D-tyrosyl-tRNA(Tyr) deacylase [Candidatus Bathyarchaeota archaeon BA1]|nr:MAG: D-tyrosyl-tRNA(Tyr) deacylase [Candidatus Bathyarchaeota archaeon BA1]
MIILVASTRDVAGMNVAQQILERYEFERLSEVFHKNPVYIKKIRDLEVRLVFVNDEPIHTQFITHFFAPQLLVFISRHSSVSGIPTLSVHTPGNLGVAELGGIPKRVSISPASAMRDALLEMARMREEMRLDYQVSYECTHHGPSLDVPTMFVELGSSLKQWKDLKAAEAVAHAAMAAISKQSRYRAVLGMGGPHYNERFTKIALSSPTAFGHIVPKYSIPQVDAEMIRQCVERTVEKVESAILDWKGISGVDKGRLVVTFDEVGVPVERV